MPYFNDILMVNEFWGLSANDMVSYCILMSLEGSSPLLKVYWFLMVEVNNEASEGNAQSSVGVYYIGIAHC